MINLAFIACFGCFGSKDIRIPAYTTVADKAGFSWSCQHEQTFDWSWIKVKSHDCDMTKAFVFVYKLNGESPHFHLHKKEIRGCDWEGRLLMQETSCNDIKSISLVQQYSEAK